MQFFSVFLRNWHCNACSEFGFSGSISPALPAGCFERQRESCSSFILPRCPHQSADQNKQHSQLNQIWPGQWNQGVNQTIRQSDCPEDTPLAPIFFSVWSQPSPAEWELILFCFFQLSAPYLHLWSCSCNSLCTGRLLCWPKYICWCQLSGITLQWIYLKKEKQNWSKGKMFSLYRLYCLTEDRLIMAYVTKLISFCCNTVHLLNVSSECFHSEHNYHLILKSCISYDIWGWWQLVRKVKQNLELLSDLCNTLKTATRQKKENHFNYAFTIYLVLKTKGSRSCFSPVNSFGNVTHYSVLEKWRQCLFLHHGWRI